MKINGLKIIITIVLILAMVFSISNIVLADDTNTIDDEFDFLEGSSTTNNTSTNNTSSNNTSSNNTNEFQNATEKDVIENTSKNNTMLNSAKNDSLNIETKNSLANTGIGDTNSLIALIITVSGIVAIYSYKKLNEYKKF